MKKITKPFLYLSMIMFFATIGEAKAYMYFKAPKIIQKTLDAELNNIKEVLNTSEQENKALIFKRDEETFLKQEAYYLTRIRFMVYPYVKFGVWFLEMKIAPMFEFRFTRKPPKGWKYFKPSFE